MFCCLFFSEVKSNYNITSGDLFLAETIVGVVPGFLRLINVRSSKIAKSASLCGFL